MKKLNFLFLFLFVFYSCDQSSQKTKVEIDEIGQNPEVDDMGLEWLKSIFNCSDSDGYCYPEDEESVFNERFWNYMVAVNNIHMRGEYLEEGEREILQKAVDEGEKYYTYFDREYWPFDRGSDTTELMDVNIKSVGDLKYEVDISYSENFKTKSLVTLIQDNDSFLIDSVVDITLDESSSETDDNVYSYTQKFSWSYINELVEDGEYGHKGEFSVYYNPDTKNWLFTKESYGISGEMINWIVGKPDGTYYSSWTSPHMNEDNEVSIKKVELYQGFELNELYKSGTVTKEFDLGSDFGKINSKQYERVYAKETNDKSYRFLAEYDADFTVIYSFSSLKNEASLPYNFEPLPKNILMLEDKSIVNGQNISLEFKGISPADKTVDIRNP